mgnify:CR=1 FL=1
MMNGEYIYPEDAPMIRIGYSNSTEFTNREHPAVGSRGGRKAADSAKILIKNPLDFLPNMP